MDKKEILPIIFGLLLIICSYCVMAVAPTPTLYSPVDNGNYSGILVFNASVDSEIGSAISNATSVGSSSVNATLWYGWGASGHANSSLLSVTNTSVNQSYFANLSLDISGLTAHRSYNFTLEIVNDTDSINSSIAFPVRINNVAPKVTAINVSGTTNYYNSTRVGQLIYLNVTVWNNLDSGVGGLSNISSVYFNITNSAGIQNGTYTASNWSTWWNVTLNTTAHPEDIYNITVYAIDICGNINSSELVYSFIIDSTGPTLSFSCSPTSSNVGGTVTCTCTATDALLSGATTTYTASPGTSSIGTHTLTCTGYDTLGNFASTTTTYTVISGSASRGTTGGATTWSNTFVLTNEQFEQGTTKQLNSKERIRVKIDNVDHHVGIKELTLTKATIEIASDPVTVELEVGGETKVDVTGDGFYDIYVKLNSITNGEADITIQKIYEEVVEDDTKTDTDTGTYVKGGEILKESKTWIYIIIGIVVLIIIGSGIGIGVKKKRKK